jgi:hypothetical protein
VRPTAICRFASTAELFTSRDVSEQDLDGDVAAKPGVAGAKHRAHPAFA